MRSAPLLLIDADHEICTQSREFFRRHGMRLEAVKDGRRALVQILHGEFDLVLLDMAIPGFPGIELLRQVRRRSDVPVIGPATDRAGRPGPLPIQGR
jgi:DNA-binding response OmpR family regulator